MMNVMSEDVMVMVRLEEEVAVGHQFGVLSREESSGKGTRV